MKEYTTVQNTEVLAETVIEKSRFIATAIGVQTVEQAVEFVNAKRKKYFDATHNCYAYIVGDKAKFSDDGEPQGTAGMPIFECLKNSGLDCVCVVVTRYFGGVKLGAGGLVHAYSGSCAQALKLCRRVKMTDCTNLEVEVDYSFLNALRRALSNYAKEVEVSYNQNVRLVFLFPTSLSNTISDIICQTTFGKAILGKKERILCDFEMKQ